MKVKFSDVVRRANTKEDRFNTDKEFYVGGEHMITGEYLITRRGTIAGSNIGPMFYFGFKKGQVLLASRSPDLKKAGMVTFDGICSEKTFVIETKDESVLLQDFLPAIVRSESFWKYANDNQSGSVNHFINWTTFANYEFDLPDIETQRKLSALLWAMERTKTAYKNLIAKTDELVKSQFVEMFGDKQSGFKYPCSKVQELTDVCSGGTPDRNNAEYWEGGTVPWVKTTELQNNVINTVDEYITEKGLADSSAKLVPAGTILIAMYGQGKTRGMTAYLGIEASTNQACACILPTEKINMVFMWQYFVNSYNELRNLAKGSNQANLNAGMIKSFPVPVPPIELQKQYSAFVEHADKSKFAAQQALADLTGAQKALMRQYLG